MKLNINIAQLQKSIEQNQRYRAALLAANLIEGGINPDQILITRRKAESEGVYHDIENISIKYPYLDSANPYIEIESGHEGIYDSVTEGLFFVGEHKNVERDKKQIIERIRRDRETEREIRKFMRLFEVEADRFRILINSTELKYDHGISYGRLSRFFAQYWDIISIMQRDDVMRFLRVIPYVSSLRGHSKAAADAISFILGVKVDIKRDFEKVSLPEHISSGWRLGDDFVLTPADNMRTEDIMLVSVSDLDTQQCKEFIKGQNKEKVLTYLCEMLLDINTQIKIVIHPKKTNRNFYLSTSDNNSSYLGINTYL